MSDINSLLSSLGLSPENDNSQFLTTSSFRRYNSNIKTNKTVANVTTDSTSSEQLSLKPVSKRKREPKKSTQSVKKRAKISSDEPTDPETAPKQPNRKFYRYCPKLEMIQFQLVCEWKECESIWNDMDCFLEHIDLHLEEAEKLMDPFHPKYVCEWLECDCLSFECVDTFKRHVRFHAFHTKLKQIGQNVLKTLEEKKKDSEDNNDQQPVPKCNLEELTRNIIPELPLKFECGWSNCNHGTDNPELFYRHIKMHVDQYPKKLKNAKCEWSECEQIIMNKSRLGEHIRHHSQEKLCSCPVCGALFSSFTRFIDHCSRTSDTGNLLFQCSHCNKKYATNNLLKEHTRKHINKMKCPVCDMTCTDRNELSKHILYKHTTHKAYKCEMCDHACKSEYDLQKHVNMKHNERFEYQCNECEFKTKDMNNMKRHMLKFHMSNENSMSLNDGQQFSSSYMCHMCNKVYCQGSTLSKHLKKMHNIELTSGHSRFRYKLESDGFYRLQTVRYESLELFELLNKKIPSVSKSTNPTGETDLKVGVESSNETSHQSILNPNEVPNLVVETPMLEGISHKQQVVDNIYPDIQLIENELNKQDGFQNETKASSSIQLSSLDLVASTSKEVNQMPVYYNAEEIQFEGFETNQMVGDVNQSILMHLETPTKINSQGTLIEKKTINANQSQKNSRLEFDLENFFF